MIPSDAGPHGSGSASTLNLIEEQPVPARVRYSDEGGHRREKANCPADAQNKIWRRPDHAVEVRLTIFRAFGR
jgi:hypothetical protein